MKEPRQIKDRLRLALAALAAVSGLAAATAPSAGASWVIHGKGFGHGVGMSQYGAFGYAQHGRGYKRILSHYYRGTTLAKAKPAKVRVLLAAAVSSVPFHGASSACGATLKPARSYFFSLSGGGVKLRRGSGAVLRDCGRQGTATGGGAIAYAGRSYRGSLVARRIASSLFAINRVGLDDYVKGVVPNEMPAEWDFDALRAQAVAARSFALATTVGGDGYDLYNDTRSQVYGGRSSEQPRSNRAVKDTARQVLKYRRKVIVAYFSSTSGGRTENVEFAFPGSRPQAYLKSVKDPYDRISPVHRWTLHRSNAAVSGALAGLYSGTLRRIKILSTGISPRIVRAKVIGSAGSTKVSGQTLQARLGLRSTWASFERR